MHEVTIPVHKVLRLFDYLERLGLNVESIAARAGLSRKAIARLESSDSIPGQQYSRLYKQSVLEMQTLKQPLPWAAGVGSEAFELMCHCMISARTLGDAIGLAQRYEKMLYPMIGHRVWLEIEGDTARLGYQIRFTERGAAALVPDGWDRADYQDTVAKASGLLIWHALCGWLVGESLEIEQANIAAPFLNAAYHDSLSTSFHSAVLFDADDTYFSFAAGQLQRRIVHTSDSLRELLDNAIYQLILIERRPASTSAAIKSLISIDLSRGLPSFASMAAQLHMSESSLRRRLQGESTSYQQLKDEVRCQVAIDKLLNEDARIADLSDYLGFTEPSSFVRSFKNWTGETPRSYREKVKALGGDPD